MFFCNDTNEVKVASQSSVFLFIKKKFNIFLPEMYKLPDDKGKK